jgi:hypothetical protein
MGRAHLDARPCFEARQEAPSITAAVQNAALPGCAVKLAAFDEAGCAKDMIFHMTFICPTLPLYSAW